MKIDLEDICQCGHNAAFHEKEIVEYQIRMNQPTIKIVTKKYGLCKFDESAAYIDPNRMAGEMISGAGFDYTNFGRHCNCNEFKMDNLRYLERRA